MAAKYRIKEIRLSSDNIYYIIQKRKRFAFIGPKVWETYVWVYDYLCDTLTWRYQPSFIPYSLRFEELKYLTIENAKDAIQELIKEDASRVIVSESVVENINA